jgi:hypothetical protein
MSAVTPEGTGVRRPHGMGEGREAGGSTRNSTTAVPGRARWGQHRHTAQSTHRSSEPPSSSHSMAPSLTSASIWKTPPVISTSSSARMRRKDGIGPGLTEDSGGASVGGGRGGRGGLLEQPFQQAPHASGVPIPDPWEAGRQAAFHHQDAGGEGIDAKGLGCRESFVQAQVEPCCRGAAEKRFDVLEVRIVAEDNDAQPLGWVFRQLHQDGCFLPAGRAPRGPEDDEQRP